MSIKNRVQDDMKTAMRAKDKERLGAIRLILAAIKQREVDERIELNDTQTLSVLEKMIKQRRESLAQYQSAGREDLAAQEAFEIELIQSYLPAPLGEADIDDGWSVYAAGLDRVPEVAHCRFDHTFIRQRAVLDDGYRS